MPQAPTPEDPNPAHSALPGAERVDPPAATRAPGRTNTLDDLIALNDEIAALARAGVPLERGLADAADELPGRIGQISRELAERLAAGQSLPAALAADPRAFPPLYRALVEAGLRSGRLAAALESLAGSARTLRDVRQTMLYALAYPVGVILLACSLLVFMLARVEPQIAPLYDGHPPTGLQDLTSAGEFATLWLPIVQGLVLLTFGCWWFRANRALVLQTGRSAPVLGWMPGVRRMIAYAQSAALAEILGLLLEHGVPLGEAVLLAADAVGDRGTREAARTLAAAVEQGAAPAASPRRAGGLAPSCAG